MIEQGEIGPDLFRHACKLGLESLVSKRRESRYRAGRWPDWVKVKNRQHPAMCRVMQLDAADRTDRPHRKSRESLVQ
jgi:ATP-dependent DNA ligase